MTMRLPTIAALLVFAGGASRDALAQQVIVVPAIGMSKDMRSATSNRWRPGLTAAASAFRKSSGSAMFGLRAGIHRWSADGEGWAADEPGANDPGNSYNVESSSGSQTAFEIIPSMRIPLKRRGNDVRLAAQIGVGLLFVSASDVTFSGTFATPSSSGRATITHPGESLTGFGIQLGVPVTIGSRLELMPVYTLYSANDLYHHIGLTLGSRIVR